MRLARLLAWPSVRHKFVARLAICGAKLVDNLKFSFLVGVGVAGEEVGFDACDF